MFIVRACLFGNTEVIFISVRGNRSDSIDDERRRSNSTIAIIYPKPSTSTNNNKYRLTSRTLVCRFRKRDSIRLLACEFAGRTIFRTPVYVLRPYDNCRGGIGFFVIVSYGACVGSTGNKRRRPRPFGIRRRATAYRLRTYVHIHFRLSTNADDENDLRSRIVDTCVYTCTRARVFVHSLSPNVWHILPNAAKHRFNIHA